jgi:hypothetical protein
MATWNTELAHLRLELEEATSSVWDDDALLTWYNDGADDFATQTKALQGSASLTASAGVQSYLLATSTLDVLSVRIGATVLVREDVQSWEALTVNPFTATGSPVAYALTGESIFLRPVPVAATATVSYFRSYTPARITTVTDSTPFGSKYDRVIRDYVKSRAFEQINDYESANFAAQRYQSEIVSAMRQRAVADSRGMTSRAPREVF